MWLSKETFVLSEALTSLPSLSRQQIISQRHSRKSTNYHSPLWSPNFGLLSSWNRIVYISPIGYLLIYHVRMRKRETPVINSLHNPHIIVAIGVYQLGQAPPLSQNQSCFFLIKQSTLLSRAYSTIFYPGKKKHCAYPSCFQIGHKYPSVWKLNVSPACVKMHKNFDDKIVCAELMQPNRAIIYPIKTENNSNIH